MHRFRSYLILLGTVFLLVGSIGFNVFEYSCAEGGVFVSYVVDKGDPCDEKKDGADACCQSHGDEDDCCDEELDFLQIKLDFFEQISVGFNAVLSQTISIPDFDAFSPVQEKPLQRIYEDPPPKLAEQQQSILQVWTI